VLENFLVNKLGMMAFDATYLATEMYTTPGYYEELKGISDASGIDYYKGRALQLVGAISQGKCSMFGSWGKASKNNHTIQLRSLDWNLDGPFYKWPAITVYHLSGELGNSWANMGILGFMGVFSGINEKQMAVSEIGVYFSDETFGNESRFGNPFTYMLRDILQFDTNLN